MSQAHVRIAVVIVNYNGGQYLNQCLEALFRQSRPADRVIVVDNDSSDGSNFTAKKAYPNIELVNLPNNSGFAAANNRAFELLEDTEWVALLNPDALPLEGWLGELELAIQTSPEHDVFASKLVDANNPKLIDGAGDLFHVSGLCWRRHHGMIDSNLLDDSDPIFSGCGAATLYRLASVRRVGGFDESYFCYYEDIDLVFRMRLSGSQCRYVESSMVQHYGSGITGKDSDFSVYHGHRNMVWTYIKNMPGWYFFLYLPQHILMNLVSILHYTVKGRARVILRAKWHALKLLPNLLRERKRIQMSRTVEPKQVIDSMVKGVFRPYFSRFR
jgi:GT2 family glycosyltransferase